MIYLIQKGMQPALAFKTMEAVRKGKVKKSGDFPGDAEQQMRDMGVPDWWIESARKIAYLFPKAHAVAYVMMAFRIAWFKVHEPLAFYSAYFYRRSQKGGFDAAMMCGGTDAVRRKINDFKRKADRTANEDDLLVTLEAVYEFNMRGFSFLPIDLYHSDAAKFLIEDGAWRAAARAASNISPSRISAMTAPRSARRTWTCSRASARSATCRTRTRSTSLTCNKNAVKTIVFTAFLMLILIPDKNKTIFAAGFAPCCVKALANIFPLFAAGFALPDTNPPRKSLPVFYRVSV